MLEIKKTKLISPIVTFLLVFIMLFMCITQYCFAVTSSYKAIYASIHFIGFNNNGEAEFGMTIDQAEDVLVVTAVFTIDSSVVDTTEFIWNGMNGLNGFSISSVEENSLGNGVMAYTIEMSYPAANNSTGFTGTDEIARFYLAPLSDEYVGLTLESIEIAGLFDEQTVYLPNHIANGYASSEDIFYTAGSSVMSPTERWTAREANDLLLSNGLSQKEIEILGCQAVSVAELIRDGDFTTAELTKLKGLLDTSVARSSQGTGTRGLNQYDLNGDNRVSSLDLAIVLLYIEFRNNEKAWTTYTKVQNILTQPIYAFMCDFVSDGVINMLDLIDLMLHYDNRKREDERYSVTLVRAGHGFTTFYIIYHFSEYYTASVGNNVTYTFRQADVHITSSREKHDTPYSVVVFDPVHENSSEIVIQRFSMIGSNSIYPGDYFAHYSKKNDTQVTYAKNNNNNSVFAYGILGGSTYHSKTIKILLNAQ